MKFFVTGASGFIGSNLVRRLTRDGHEVKILTRSIKNTSDFQHKNVTAVLGNITDYNLVRNATRGADVIVNVAGALPHHNLSESQYWETNVLGVENILKSCGSRNIKRLVHISTVGIYGPASGSIISETSRLHLNDVYSKSKAAGENLVFRSYKKTGLPVTIIKPTIGYGPGDIRPGFSNLFSLIKKRVFVPVGTGKNFLHTVYVDNLVDGILLSIKKQKAIGEDFIIGDEPCPTMGKIIKTISEVEGVDLLPIYLPEAAALGIGKIFDVGQKLGVPALLNTRRVKFITENRKYSIEKAKKMLGFKPKVSLKDGIGRTYEWYKENGYI